MPLDLIVGGQYGSEGKGAVAAAYAERYQFAIRVGGPNAGHTFYHEGRKWVARQLPIGWINPDCLLFIGAGAVVDIDVLTTEVMEVEAQGYRVRHRLVIDTAAVLVTQELHGLEGGTTGELWNRIGSTGEGVGAARVQKIARGSSTLWHGPPALFVGDLPASHPLGDCFLSRTEKVINNMLEKGRRGVIEGTQGFGLSLHHGSWPFVTSDDTTAQALLTAVGVGPRHVRNVILVCRAHPIRVAGNSGPMLCETTWESVGQPEERTTVTKKVRRVGAWDAALVEAAARVNGASQAALTFADYLDPDVAGKTSWAGVLRSSPAYVTTRKLEQASHCPVVYIGTGPDTYIAGRTW